MSQSLLAIQQGIVQGKRRKGRQKKRWENNIKQWTGMGFASSTRAAEDRTRQKGNVVKSSIPTTSQGYGIEETRLEFHRTAV